VVKNSQSFGGGNLETEFALTATLTAAQTTISNGQSQPMEREDSCICDSQQSTATGRART
jgi:hypothetical protein